MSAELQYYLTLSLSIAYMIVACITLAHYCRARWKWVIAPVFFVGLALLTTWVITAWAGTANSGWLFFNAPVVVPAVIVGG